MHGDSAAAAAAAAADDDDIDDGEELSLLSYCSGASKASVSRKRFRPRLQVSSAVSYGVRCSRIDQGRIYLCTIHEIGLF